ncbi:MAG TPA: trypsin-like serine protease [Labilithrix sp.]|nr:trypsin-like serine protease [Labilithrix sp.]
MSASWLIRVVRALAGAAILASSACAAEAAGGDELSPNEGPIAATQQAITHGADDDGDPAVVALLQGGKVYCTGVLVTPNVVATAAHCVTPSPPDQVYFGVDPASKKGTFIDVSDSKAHPDFDEDTLLDDIAVVGLASKAPVAPMPVQTRPFDASFTHLAIRLVGFGMTGDRTQTNLRKRSGDTTVATFSDTDFRFKPTPSQTCNGDSGGPALAHLGGRDVVIGLASSGDADCATYGRHVRIDPNVTFLLDYTKAYANHQTLVPMANSGCSVSGGAAPGSAAWLLVVLGATALLRRRAARRATSGSA